MTFYKNILFSKESITVLLPRKIRNQRFRSQSSYNTVTFFRINVTNHYFWKFLPNFYIGQFALFFEKKCNYFLLQQHKTTNRLHPDYLFDYIIVILIVIEFFLLKSNRNHDFFNTTTHLCTIAFRWSRTFFW